jgi:hypothetical protein
MKRAFLTIAFLMLACAATLAPIRSTPPMLFSDADGADWKCSRSAVILTICAPSGVLGTLREEQQQPL